MSDRRERSGVATLLLTGAVLLRAGSAAAEPDWGAAARETGDLLQRLIRVDTTNAPSAPATAHETGAGGAAPVWRETEAARLVADELKKDGIESTIYESLLGRGNLVARLHGSGAAAGGGGEGGALVLLAHLDVVGVERDKWTVDPFAGEIRDGHLYGRGAVDDKGMAAACVEVMRLLARGKVPLRRDVILCLNADEESSGKMGIQWLLANHPEALAGAAFALNEGGKVIQNRGAVRAVWIQTEEKQYLDLKLTAHGTSGHSSRPLPDNAIAAMSRAIARLSAWSPPFLPTPTTVRYFRGVAALEAEPVATFMRSLDNPDPGIARHAAELLAGRSALYASMLRTSVAPTIFRSGIRENVLPSTAEANVNCRLLPGEDPDAFVAEVKRVMAEPAVEVTYERRTGPEAKSSSFDTPCYAAIEAACRAMHPEAVVVPFMSTGATDSRFLRAKGIEAYGMDPFPITPENGERMHGHDERMAVSSLEPGVELLYDIVVRTAGR